MLCGNPKTIVPSGGCFAVCLMLASAWPAWAQGQHLWLREHHWVTPMSVIIDAQANYLVAQGSFLESSAISRNINADAYAKELKNWVGEVDAWYRRRELARMWRRKENPDFIMLETHRQQALEKQLREQFQKFSEGDVTGRLNWLLMKMAGPMIGVQYLSGTELTAEFDREISDGEKHTIWITDGGPATTALVCRLGEGEVLHANWPFPLLDPQFDAGRAEFEAARDKVKEEILAEKPISVPSGQRLINAISQLLAALPEVYTPEARREPSVFLKYNTAKNYLRSLMGQVDRAVSIRDQSIFNQSLRFTGNTVGQLIQHMCRYGVTFAHPQAGGEGVYRRLLEDLGRIYVTLSPEKSGADNGEKALDPEKKLKL